MNCKSPVHSAMPITSRFRFLSLTAALLISLPSSATVAQKSEPPKEKSTKSAEKPDQSEAVMMKLKSVQRLIGEWKGTATPLDRESKRKREFWKETSTWSWSLAKDKLGLVWKIENSNRFKQGFLTFVPEESVYRLTLERVTGPQLTLTGKLAENKLELAGPDEAATFKLTISIPNESRFIYQVAAQADASTPATKLLEVGNTKAGITFATKSGGPECIVTGGLGTIEVRHKGKTYYVCCSGCKDEFEADPEKYINKKPR